MGWESSDWSDLTMGSSFKVKRGQPNLKVLITCLLLFPEVCNMKPTYRKSWAGNLLMWSDLTLGSSMSNDGSLAFVSCLSGGYKFTSVLGCARSSYICHKLIIIIKCPARDACLCMGDRRLRILFSL